MPRVSRSRLHTRSVRLELVFEFSDVLDKVLFGPLLDLLQVDERAVHVATLVALLDQHRNEGVKSFVLLHCLESCIVFVVCIPGEQPLFDPCVFVVLITKSISLFLYLV